MNFHPVREAKFKKGQIVSIRDGEEIKDFAILSVGWSPVRDEHWYGGGTVEGENKDGKRFINTGPGMIMILESHILLVNTSRQK